MGANGASATSGSYSRRAFLGRVGAGVGAVVLGGRLFVPPVESAYASTDPQHFAADVPEPADILAGQPRRRTEAKGAGCPGRHFGRAGPVERGAGAAHHQSGTQRSQPGQPHAHGRGDVRRSVHRPRHDVRRYVEARHGDESPHSAQLTHTDARPGLSLRRWPGRKSRAVRPERQREASHRLRRESSRTCRARPAAPRSSAIRATTRR